MDAPVAVILAAGKSTRMNSAKPKVIHEVCGRPMIEYVLDAARAVGVTRNVVIVGHEAEQVKQALNGHADVEFALQADQKGTGHAVMMCQENLANHRGPVFILTGDAPLMRASSFRGLLEDFHQTNAACVIGTATTEANFGLGRIVRDTAGDFQKIVEEKDANEEEKRIQEVNVGCYVFDCEALFAALSELKPINNQGEYYLTDCAAILLSRGLPVIASCKLDIEEAMGVNTRAQLAEVHEAMEQAFIADLMTNGVTVVSPAQTYIDPRATIGRDSIIAPFSVILGAATIGGQCRIGPHAVIHPGAHVPDGTVVPPFAVVGPSD